MNDSTLATMLLTSHPESLDDKSPDGYAALPVEDKHSVIERALQALMPGTGLTFDQPENGLWVRVSLAHEGRTPLSQVEDYRWIRLSSIDQVIPKVALGSGQDSRGWGWNLMVKTNGGCHFQKTTALNVRSRLHYSSGGVGSIRQRRAAAGQKQTP